MKNKKIYGFKIDKHIIDIEAHNEQGAFRLLGVNFWHLISYFEKVELLGELQKIVEPSYKKDKQVELLSRKKNNKIEILKENVMYKELFKLLEENTDSTYGSYYLEYNDHHNVYVNRENNGRKYEERFFEHYCYGCSDEEDYREEVEDIKEHVKDFDRVYKLVWYKDTPTGSYTLYGSDLEIIKEQVKEILEG